MNRKLLPLLLIFGLCLSACTISIPGIVNIEFPGVQKVGALVTEQIDIPVPAGISQPVDLNLKFGAGTLKLRAGSASLLSGTAEYNIADFKPVITQEGAYVKIEQGNWHLEGIPDFSKVKNEWDFTLGNAPMDLSIDAGAYMAEYELGGLALTSLSVKDGASDVELNFASPNLAQMSLLKFETGASNVSLTGLGNANFAALEFNSGAGNYTLDFSGAFQQAATVQIETGVSNITLVIPEGITCQVTQEGALANVTHSSSFNQEGSVYSQAGSTPLLMIVVKIGAGNLTITQ
jgi:hypothetical protein